MLWDPHLLCDRPVVGPRWAVGGTGPRRIASYQYQNIVRAAHHRNHHARLLNIEPPRPIVGVSRLLAAPISLLLVSLHPLQRHSRPLVEVILDLCLGLACLAQ